EVQHLGQGVDDQGLGQAGHARDDAVAADEERDQHLLDHVVLSDDQLAQLTNDAVTALLHALGEGYVVRAGLVEWNVRGGHFAPVFYLRGGIHSPSELGMNSPPETPHRAPPLRGAALTGRFAGPHRALIHDGALAAHPRALALLLPQRPTNEVDHLALNASSR